MIISNTLLFRNDIAVSHSQLGIEISIYWHSRRDQMNLNNKFSICCLLVHVQSASRVMILINLVIGGCELIGRTFICTSRTEETDFVLIFIFILHHIVTDQLTVLMELLYMIDIAILFKCMHNKLSQVS